MKQKILLVIAVFFGILAFILTHQQIKNEKNKILGMARDVDLIQMVKPLAEGDTITISDIKRVRTKRFNSNSIREVRWSQRESILQRQVDVPIDAGSFLRWEDMKAAGYRSANELAGDIPRGKRAVSISVDNVSSVTNMIKPGNRVDIIGTFRFPEMRGDQAFDTLTLTILQNVEVLAIGNAFKKSDAARIRSYSSVTLALTPKESEMVIFASQKGRLQLILRNFQESSITDDTQSINFKYFEEHIKDYIEARKKRY
jgi:pilus assembly protein CpaB